LSALEFVNEELKKVGADKFKSNKDVISHNIDGLIKAAIAFRGPRAMTLAQKEQYRIETFLNIIFHNVQNKNFVKDTLHFIHTKLGKMEHSQDISKNIRNKKMTEIFNPEQAYKNYLDYQGLLHKWSKLYGFVHPDDNKLLAQALFQEYKDRPVVLETYLNDKSASLNLSLKDTIEINNTIKEIPLITTLSKIFNREFQIHDKVYAIGDSQKLENLAFARRFPAVTALFLEKFEEHFGLKYEHMNILAQGGKAQIEEIIKMGMKNNPQKIHEFIKLFLGGQHDHFEINLNKIDDIFVLSRPKTIEQDLRKILEKKGYVKEDAPIDWSDKKVYDWLTEINYSSAFEKIKDIIGHTIIIPDELLFDLTPVPANSSERQKKERVNLMQQICAYLSEYLLQEALLVPEGFNPDTDRVTETQIYLRDRKDRSSLRRYHDLGKNNKAVMGKYYILLKRTRLKETPEGVKPVSIRVNTEINALTLAQHLHNETDESDSHLKYRYGIGKIAEDSVFVLVADKKSQNMRIKQMKKGDGPIELFMALNPDMHARDMSSDFKVKLEKIKFDPKQDNVFSKRDALNWSETTLKNLDIISFSDGYSPFPRKKLFEALKKREFTKMREVIDSTRGRAEQ
jgi:hypothetical protein